MSLVRLARICTARSRGIHSARCRSFNTSQQEKPYYITTPIFYPNAVPHIGHLYSLVIADVFARFQRLRGTERPVHFLAGTDEHGLKIQKAAQAKDMRPGAFCDELSEKFRLLAESAGVSNTCFMRTTSREHHETVAEVWRRLDAKGLIYKGDYSGWYSITDECFYTDSQVTQLPSQGASPPTTISTETGSIVEWQNEQNYMFRLSSFQKPLLTHYGSPANAGIIHPPQHHAHIVQILQSGPLADLSISRPRSRLGWGVQVPGDPEQTVYVWFDALLVYLTGRGFPWSANGRQEGWPADLQVIGKDILRFHALYLPAILLALELPLQKRLLAHAHWTVEQKKMSKSLGNVADPFEAIREHGLDVVRYYLARVGGRFRDDVDWSQEQLGKHDKEIQSLLGNFFMRITSATIQKRMVGAPRLALDVLVGGENAALVQAQRDLPGKVEECLGNLEVGEAIERIVDVLRLANKTITDIAPWHPSTPPEVTYASYRVSLETMRVAGICLQPFVPGVAGRLLDALGVPAGERTWRHAGELGGGRVEDGTGSGAVKGVRLF